VISRLKQTWAAEYAAWSKGDLLKCTDRGYSREDIEFLRAVMMQQVLKNFCALLQSI
jgi:hypothetical protein